MTEEKETNETKKELLLCNHYIENLYWFSLSDGLLTSTFSEHNFKTKLFLCNFRTQIQEERTFENNGNCKNAVIL